MMQYVPQDGLYVYFRYDAKQTIMCVMNASGNVKTIDFGKYADRTKGFGKAVSVTGDNVSFSTADKPQLASYNMWVLELK